jgi:hypothetical protein
LCFNYKKNRIIYSFNFISKINQTLSIHNEFVQTIRDFGHLNKLFGVQFLTLVYGENSDEKEEII